jgi:LmbE family N-acetylglucosaminyl deacetylase
MTTVPSPPPVGPAPDAGGSPRIWSSDDGVRKVLVVTAHPDDVDFGSAGTVAAFTAAGVDVAYCIVTSGEAGGSDRSVTRAEMAALRQREQREAASRVGVHDLWFLGYPDGRVTSSFDLRRDISRVIRMYRPERVITQSPERQWDRIYAGHPDHLATGEAATCAVYPDARNPFAHTELLDDEGLEPHTVDELWLMAAQRGNVVVDTTRTVDDKLAALLCHKSQIADEGRIEEIVRRWGAATAREAGMPDGSFAESFLAVDTR